MHIIQVNASILFLNKIKTLSNATVLSNFYACFSISMHASFIVFGGYLMRQASELLIYIVEF